MRKGPPQSLGVLSEERLLLVPARHWHSHEYCFYLHDQMLLLLQQYQESEVHLSVEKVVRRIVDELPESDLEVDLIGLLQKPGLTTAYKHHLVCHLVFGLTADMLHFLYEALSAFEKRKFAVAYALLRKPLKENLLFLCWLLGMEDDFIQRFDSSPHTTLNGQSPEQRIAVIAAAVEKLPTSDAFDPVVIHETIYAKSDPAGFEPVWQKASHLVTSQGALLRTNQLELNFLFVDWREEGFFDHVYGKLPYLLAFACQVVTECFGRILRYNERTVSHLVLVTMGCYESLFLKHRSEIANALRKSLSGMFDCPQCGVALRMGRSDWTRMFLVERITCRACKLDSPFPLYWLLAKGNVVLSRVGRNASILDMPASPDDESG